MTEFDKEIVREAEAMCDYLKSPCNAHPLARDAIAGIFKAVAAKREAETIGGLSREEARVAYSAGYGHDITHMSDQHFDGMKSLGDAIRKRAFAVIEALPHVDGDAFKRHLSHIQSALQPKS